MRSLFLTLALLSGCASGTVAPPEAGHPASPSTEEGVSMADVHTEPSHAESSTPAASASGYSCPMHPEVTAEKPGQCPKCGMNLVPIKKDAP